MFRDNDDVDGEDDNVDQPIDFLVMVFGGSSIQNGHVVIDRKEIGLIPGRPWLSFFAILFISLCLVLSVRNVTKKKEKTKKKKREKKNVFVLCVCLFLVLKRKTKEHLTNCVHPEMMPTTLNC